MRHEIEVLRAGALVPWPVHHDPDGSEVELCNMPVGTGALCFRRTDHADGCIGRVTTVNGAAHGYHPRRVGEP